MSATVLNIISHAHSGSWIVLIILFILSVVFKRQKVTPMILRLFYLIMIASGVSMLVSYDFPTSLVIKGVLAIILIGLMEMILGRVKRDARNDKALPILITALIVILALVILLGYGVISF